MTKATQTIITIIFIISTVFLAFRKTFGLTLNDEMFQTSVFAYFGFCLTLIWYNNRINEKKVDKFIQEEESRDKNEYARQERTFEVLSRLTNAIVEIFPNSEYHKKYYEFRISTAKEKVDDLTWAIFDREGKLDAIEPYYLKKIQEVADSGVNYDEIFIFHKDNLNHIERLKKLQYHYNKAMNSKSNSKYSCSYFDISELGFNFPRLQFTIIDNEEILFTSSINGNEKFKIKNRQLTKVFKNYYDEAWELSTKLIINGKIVNEEKILQLIRSLT